MCIFEKEQVKNIKGLKRLKKLISRVMLFMEFQQRKLCFDRKARNYPGKKEAFLLELAKQD